MLYTGLDNLSNERTINQFWFFTIWLRNYFMTKYLFLFLSVTKAPNPIQRAFNDAFQKCACIGSFSGNAEIRFKNKPTVYYTFTNTNVVGIRKAAEKSGGCAAYVTVQWGGSEFKGAVNECGD